jgi:hypothetical protein
MTVSEFAAQKASERAEQIAKLLAPVEERRRQLEGRQAHIATEVARLQVLPHPSVANTAQLAELELEAQTLRNTVEVTLNADEANARNAVARLT